MDNINILSWNVQGLNQRARRDALRGIVMTAKAYMVCIQENKLNVIDQSLVNVMFGPQYTTFSFLPATQTRGGVIVVGCHPDVLCTPLHIGDYLVTVDVNFQDTTWHLTCLWATGRR